MAKIKNSTVLIDIKTIAVKNPICFVLKIVKLVHFFNSFVPRGTNLVILL